MARELDMNTVATTFDVASAPTRDVADPTQRERWPLPKTALLVVMSSSLLWFAIIVFVAMLLG